MAYFSGVPVRRPGTEQLRRSFPLGKSAATPERESQGKPENVGARVVLLFGEHKKSSVSRAVSQTLEQGQAGEPEIASYP